VVMAQYAEVRPAQQLHRGAAQALVQRLPMAAALRPLPQQWPQRLAWPLAGQGLQARRCQRVQLQALKGIGQPLHQRRSRLLQQHGLIVLQIHQQQRLARITQQCLALSQRQPLAQQAGDGVRAICQADRRRCLHGQGLRCQLHATQRATDGTVIKHVLMPVAITQLAADVLDPALQARTLLPHALGGVAQRRGIADDQQIAIVQILAAADLAIRQRRGQAQPLQQGLLALDIGSHYQHACHPCSPCGHLPGGLASPRLGHRQRRPS